MKRFFVFLALAPVLLILSCASMQPAPESEIDPGPYPENYESIIKQHLSQTLFDPYSVQDFSIDAPPIKIYLNSGFPAFGLKKGHGVYECKFVWYNAKNRMGGYTGRKGHIYFIRHGRVVAAF